MSTTDEARLDAIDRRGRAAAQTLLDDLAGRGTRPAITDDVSTAAAAGPGRPVVPRDRRPASPRWLAAAAVVLLAAVVGAVIATDDDRPDVRSGLPPDLLLPGWLPEGFEPASVIDVPDAATIGYDADIAVYGDPNAEDPWSATLTVTHLVADEDILGGPPSGDETVTVAGHDASLRDEFADGQGWEVEWQVDDGRLIVGGALTRDEVLAAAEVATTEPAIGSSGLPDGFAELARGPSGAADLMLFTSLFEGNLDDSSLGSANGSGLAVTYADPSGTGSREASRPAVVVAQRRGPASAVDLLRLWFPDADTTTVRGRQAVVGRNSEQRGSAGENGVVAIQWAEPEGQLVTVVGYGVAEDAVRQVAENMRSASADEVADLQDEHTVAAPRDFGELSEGHVVAAEGGSPTGRWRIVADTTREANVGALTIERVWGAIASTVSTTGDRVEPPLDLGADVSDGTIVIWGVLWVDAATVTVEGPGADPVTLDIHEVEGWALVARDEAGREVGRNSTVLG